MKVRKIVVNKVSEEYEAELLDGYNEDRIDYHSKGIEYLLWILVPAAYRNRRDFIAELGEYLKGSDIPYKAALETVRTTTEYTFSYGKDKEAYAITMLYNR